MFGEARIRVGFLVQSELLQAFSPVTTTALSRVSDYFPAACSLLTALKFHRTEFSFLFRSDRLSAAKCHLCRFSAAFRFPCTLGLALFINEDSFQGLHSPLSPVILPAGLALRASEAQLTRLVDELASLHFG